MIEAVSTNGNDNLLLPLLTYSFIRYHTSHSLDLLLTPLGAGVMLLILIAIVCIHKLTNITKLSIAYSLLVVYIVMILGGVLWVFPPLMLLLTFGILPMMRRAEKQMTQTYKVIESNAVVGVVCLYVSVFFPHYRDTLYIAFSFSFACLLAINTYSRFINFMKSSQGVAIICALVKAVVFIAVPTLFLAKLTWIEFTLYLVFLALAIPPAMILNRKLDYTNVGDKTFNANKILTGTLVAIFTAVLIIV